MQILFSFTFNPETKELIYTSNIKSQAALPTALRILQDALISQARQQGADQAVKATKKEKTKDKP